MSNRKAQYVRNSLTGQIARVDHWDGDWVYVAGPRGSKAPWIKYEVMPSGFQPDPGPIRSKGVDYRALDEKVDLP